MKKEFDWFGFSFHFVLLGRWRQLDQEVKYFQSTTDTFEWNRWNQIFHPSEKRRSSPINMTKYSWRTSYDKLELYECLEFYLECHQWDHRTPKKQSKPFVFQNFVSIRKLETSKQFLSEFYFYQEKFTDTNGIAGFCRFAWLLVHEQNHTNDNQHNVKIFRPRISFSSDNNA